MAWYIVCVLVGMILGMLLEDATGVDISYKGKIKQKGQNNRIELSKLFKRDNNTKKKRKFKLKHLFKRNK